MLSIVAVHSKPLVLSFYISDFSYDEEINLILKLLCNALK